MVMIRYNNLRLVLTESNNVQDTLQETIVSAISRRRLQRAAQLTQRATK